MSVKKIDAIVVGAGMAGLAAARKIAEAGASTLVLEARDRVGGRIHTLHREGETVELGAEFVHGKPPELWRLLEEADLQTTEVEGANACVENGNLHKCENMGEEAFAVLDKLKNWEGEDMSFAEYLAQHPMPDVVRQKIIGYVEGFNAADHSVIGVAALGRQQAAEQSIEGDRAFRVRGGYSQVAEFLARKVRDAGGEILLRSVVRQIAWQRGDVNVECASADSPTTYAARRAVIALPLGVLQSGAVVFTPTAPAIREAARLRMGNVCRFTLAFREKFWAESSPHPIPHLSFLFSNSEAIPVWWTCHPEPGKTLTGWAGGPRSQALAQLSNGELARKACSELAAIFSMRNSSISGLLIGCHSHPWQDDPFSMGAYSYVPASALAASENMTIPAEDTLFFAGEHTDTTGNWGTVHAALQSGHRAARQVLAAAGSPRISAQIS